MTFGGTNWGNLAEPTVYTSYDYGAPITESRGLRPKYHELKLQSHFLHASPDLLTSSPLAQGTGLLVDNTAVFTSVLGGNANGVGFYVVRQNSNQ